MVPTSILIFFAILRAERCPFIIASEFSFNFNVDLSSINIIAVKPDEPVLILSPSASIVPGFKFEKLSLPTA